MNRPTSVRESALLQREEVKLSSRAWRSLHDSLDILRSSPQRSVHYTFESVYTAAEFSLRQGQCGIALKIASRALSMKPQDEKARQLVREGAKELEFEGRKQSLTEAEQAPVAQILKVLQSDEEFDVRQLLDELAKELDIGGIDAQVAFHLQNGWPVVMSFFNHALYSHVSEVLIAAGSCQLYNGGSQQPWVTAEVTSRVAAAKYILRNRNRRPRIRWPQSVLDQLLSAVIGNRQSSNTDGYGIAECSLLLLAVAALDSQQRQTGLASFTAEGGVEGIMSGLSDAIMSPCWIENLPISTLLLVSRIVFSYASGTHLDRQLLARFSKGKAMQLLLCLYRSASKLHVGQINSTSQDCRPPCCEVCHIALSSMISLASCEPELIWSEAFQRLPPTGCQSSVSSGRLTATVLLKELLKEATSALKHSRPCTVPDLSWDGSTKAYVQGKIASDPCIKHSSKTAAVAAAAESTTAVTEESLSLVEKWILILTASGKVSKSAVQELHKNRVMDVLEETLTICCGSPASLRKSVEKAYGCFARLSQAFAQDILDSASPTALVGMALHSKQSSLALKALDRLTPKIDQLGGTDFMQLLQPGGIAAATHALILITLNSKMGSASEGPHPWDLAVASATQGFNSGNINMDGQVAPNFLHPNSKAMIDASRCLFLSCLDRSRRMAGLKPMQVPRIGYWAMLRPRELQLTERRLREEFATAMLPLLPNPSSDGTTAGGWKKTNQPCTQIKPTQESIEKTPGSLSKERSSPDERQEYPQIIQVETVTLPHPFANCTPCLKLEDGKEFSGGFLEGSRRSECLEDSANDRYSTSNLRSRSEPCRLTQTPIHQQCEGDLVDSDLLREPQSSKQSKSDMKQNLLQQQALSSSGQYDEDGLRVVWDSTPNQQTKESRIAWRSLSLGGKIQWSQTSDEVNVWIKVPKGTSMKEISVTVQPQQLCIKLGWFGRFLDGQLKQRVKNGESVWCMTGEDDSKLFDVLHLMMPKSEVHYWKSLFEGSDERSHMELLKEAVEADEKVVCYDDMDDGAKEIFESLRERQAMVTAGMIDLENSFDDFRVVIGDGTL